MKKVYATYIILILNETTNAVFENIINFLQLVTGYFVYLFFVREDYIINKIRCELKN